MQRCTHSCQRRRVDPARDLHSTAQHSSCRQHRSASVQESSAAVRSRTCSPASTDLVDSLTPGLLASVQVTGAVAVTITLPWFMQTASEHPIRSELSRTQRIWQNKAHNNQACDGDPPHLLMDRSSSCSLLQCWAMPAAPPGPMLLPLRCSSCRPGSPLASSTVASLPMLNC